MVMKKIVAGCIAGISVLCAVMLRASDLELTCLRAERAFRYGEWAQTAALTELALDEKPDSARLYARAIVAEDMLGDTVRSTSILERAMAHGVALDSVVDAVRADAFVIGEARVYDRFLLRTRSRMPWLARAIDARLLDYYAFRGDGERVVRLASSMLRGLPDSMRYLSLLARGHDLCGDISQADAVRRRILAIDPDNLEALRALGCSLMQQGDRTQAHTLLERARQLEPTPYIDQMLLK